MPDLGLPEYPWMDAARSQLNVGETWGKSDGPEIEGYLKTVGLPGGYEWCAAFVNWTLRQSGMSGNSAKRDQHFSFQIDQET